MLVGILTPLTPHVRNPALPALLPSLVAHLPPLTATIACTAATTTNMSGTTANTFATTSSIPSPLPALHHCQLCCHNYQRCCHHYEHSCEQFFYSCHHSYQHLSPLVAPLCHFLTLLVMYTKNDQLRHGEHVLPEGLRLYFRSCSQFDFKIVYKISFYYHHNINLLFVQ